VRGSYDLLADTLGHDVVAEALLVSAARGVSLVSALIASGNVDANRLAAALENASAPLLPVMREPRPVMRLVDALPPKLCERLLAVPVGHDRDTGIIEVAVVDGADTHAAEEIAYWLGAPVRVVLAALSTMVAALQQVREMQQRRKLPEMQGLREPVIGPHLAPPGSSVTAGARGADDGACESPSADVPTQRGPFQQSAAADDGSDEPPVPTRRGH
jgi:type II secretion system (T2SS) protein E